MGNYADYKFVIIGLGNLAEYMCHCCKELLGEQFASNITAVKASERNLREKEEKFGFRILVGEIDRALEETHPDVIFLSPPPKQVPGVAKDHLLPYYESLRRERKALPILLNFAPDPKPDFFYSLIGEDLRVVNILPNMMSNVSGIDTARCGYNFVTFDPKHRWSEEEKEFLKAFLSPVGNYCEVPPEIISPVLASKVMGRPVIDLCLIISDQLKKRGEILPFSNVASAMRAHFRTLIPNMTPDPYHCAEGDVPLKYRSFLNKTIEHWFYGIRQFCSGVGVPEEIITTCGRFKIEMQLLATQLQSYEEIQHNTEIHATKGGVVEKACLLFDELCREKFTSAFQQFLAGELPDSFWEEWQDLAAEINRRIAEHAGGLSKK